jgi:hypothetical protein
MLMLNVQRKLTGCKWSSGFFTSFILVCGLQLTAGSFLNAQDNSPYSRYGIGDLHPFSNIYNRGMAGISAAHADQSSVNFVNPASYSRFFAVKEDKSKKLARGIVLLDVGLNFDNRTLRETNNPEKFTSPNAYFSYLQLGVPVKKDWGIVLGLRPVSKINYDILRNERLIDPNTNLPIDSAQTQFLGDGGAFLVNTGTGFAIKNFSAGINIGYLFGKKDYSTRRELINDSVAYNRSNHQTKTSFGDIFINGGLQYKVMLDSSTKTEIRFGVFGNLKQELNARRDVIRETFIRSNDVGDFRLDSVSEQLDVRGTITYPASFGGGIMLERPAGEKKGGWLFGIDFVQNAWDDYRFYGQTDAVASNWQLKIGGQIRPAQKEVKYKNFMSYRAGVFFGNDYIFLGKKLPEFGVSAGISLPVIGLKDPSRRFRTQYTVVNISAEYIKRGNKDNLLREDIFRLSAGFSLSDVWFVKRKYD